MVEVTRQKFPEYPFPTIFETTDVPIIFDNTKSIKDLGITYRPLAETMQDMFAQLIDEGVVQKA